jgi:hypothetical protein
MGQGNLPHFSLEDKVIYFDHDPVTGVVQYYDYDPMTDSHSITSVQDVSAFLDEMKRKRDDPDYWKKGVKEEFAHYATIPAVVEMQLKAKGIDLYDKDATKALIREIETHYPFCKTTTARIA